MNTRILFNDGWTFAKTGPDAEGWQELAFEPVDLPHDWFRPRQGAAASGMLSHGQASLNVRLAFRMIARAGWSAAFGLQCGCRVF